MALRSIHSRAVLLIVCGAGSAEADPVAGDFGSPVDTKGQVGPGTLEVAPALGSDIDPDDAWALAALGSLAHRTLPPLQLKLELKPVLHLTPFATATWFPSQNLTTGFVASDVGAAFTHGPMQFETRFSVNRASRGLLLRNVSSTRYVRPRFDLGIETVTHYPLIGEPRVPPHLLLGSTGYQPTEEAPRLRFSTALFPELSRQYSSLMAFGRF